MTLLAARLPIWMLAAGLALVTAVPAPAGEAAVALRAALYEGERTAAGAQLETLAATGDAEARFGLGLLGLVRGIEGLAQGLHRLGLEAPDAGPFGSMLALPVPVNPEPEPFSYAAFRAVLAGFADDMDAAHAQLVTAGEAGDFVVMIDPLRIRLDVDGDGTAEPSEAIGQLLAPLLGLAADGPGRPPTLPEEPRPGAGASKIDNLGDPAAREAWAVGFDRADALWLAGYSQIAAAQADFLLAHDFSPTVDAAFHRLFPRGGLPMQPYAEGGTLVLDPGSDASIADLIAALHTLDWPVVEPERLARVRSRMLAVIALSRRNWTAILAETDDVAELLPGPHQTPLPGAAPITEAMVPAWLSALDAAEAVLEGELLLPHWRFQQGFDLRAYFESAERTDLVMILTGLEALPYLRAGPVANAETFAEANAVFGDALLGYMFWFN